MGMFGEKNKAILIQSIRQQIRRLIVISCAALKEDTAAGNEMLANDEEAITYRLVEYYLNDDEFRRRNHLNRLLVRFQPEHPVNLDVAAGRYRGIGDIQVIGEDYLHNANAYGLIECKRLDGTPLLKREYVNEGIDRFVGALTGKIKYPRHIGEDIMIGYLVAPMQFEHMLDELNKYLKRRMPINVRQELQESERMGEGIFCSSVFQCADGEAREIRHLFYDFDGVVE